MAIECPKCGLFNPDRSSKCDCGFAFVAGAQLAPTASTRQVPTSLRVYIAGLFLAASLRIYLVATRPSPRYSWQSTQGETQAELVFTIVWAFVAVVLALNLISRKNWARVALGIWSLPMGLFLFLSPTARVFTGGSDGDPAELRLRG